MSKYEIQRWDAVLAPNGLNKLPMIYIKPDLPFLEFIKSNDYVVFVKIQDTNSNYDNKEILGIVNKASFMPNFFEETSIYVVNLKCVWIGYPPNLGTATFLGYK